jgi:hypothetical protein
LITRVAAAFWFFDNRRDRFAGQIVVAVFQDQDQPGLRLIKGVGRHDRGESKGGPLLADPGDQKLRQSVARLLGAGAGRDRRLRKVLGKRVDVGGSQGFGFHGLGPLGVDDVGRMGEGGDG